MDKTSDENDEVTLINVFSVEPENQKRLVELIAAATDEVIKDLPGFMSTRAYQGRDGTRVVNFAQWRSREDFEAMLKHSAVRERLQPTGALAPSDAQLYGIAFTREAAASGAAR